MDYLYISFAAALFVAVSLLLAGVCLAWNASHGREAQRIARRLQMLSDDATADQRKCTAARQPISLLKGRVLSAAPPVQRLLMRMSPAHAIDRLLEQSGLVLNVAQFFLASLGCGLAVLAPLLFFNVPAAMTTGIAALAIPLLYAIGKKRKRLARIEQQLPDALDLMSRALRAGHALPSAIRMVGDEMPDPLAREFRILSDEVNYGVSLPDALRSLSSRLPGTDAGYFVVAVLIQRETGGNLTELLGNIAALARERLKLSGQIRVFSAEGRLSAWILGVLPFGIAAVLQLGNPEFLPVLWTDPGGRKMLGGMLLLMAFGVVWMRKLVRIRI
jgi:tight adherence protein B